MTELGESVVGDARRRLRRLELDVTRRLDGLLHGDHRGLVPGHGSELGETRVYQPGDDVRRIDWNVTARLDTAHIRETIAERELETWIIADIGARMAMGTVNREKRDLEVAAAAALGFLTQRDGNRIGAILSGPLGDEVIAPRSSRRHLMHVLHRLQGSMSPEGSGVTDLGAAIRRAGAVTKRRGLVAVISDFRIAPDWERSLRMLSRQHDVIVFEIVDPLELELPNVGVITVVDPATGDLIEVPTHKRSVRDAYADAAARRRAELQTTFRQSGVDHVEMRTDHDWLDDVVHFVVRRRHRLRHSARASA